MIMCPVWFSDLVTPPNGDSGGNMRRSILVALCTGTVISSAAAIGIGAAVSSAPQTMSRSEYEAALRGIEAARGQVAAKCDALDAFGRESCHAEASANEMVRVADIEEGYRRTRQSSREAQRARIEARYQVERTRCGTLGGFKRDKCLVSAHAAKGRALLEAAAPYEARF
jgi:hypothetical protein